MAKPGPITTKQAEALSQAMGRHFAQAGKGPDRPAQGETRRPVTRDLLKQAQQALLKLADGRGSQLEEWERRELAEYLDRIRGSEAISRNPDASSALHTASEALKSLTAAPAKPADSRPTSTRSTPSYLEAPEWPGVNSSPQELYGYELRSAWRGILRAVIYKAPSNELPGHPFSRQHPADGIAHVQWFIFRDRDRELWLDVTYKDGKFEKAVFIIRSGDRHLSRVTLFNTPTPYSAAEEEMVSFLTNLYLQGNPLPQPPAAPSRSEIARRGFASVFTLGRAELASERFERETRDYEAALEVARRAVCEAPVPSLSFFKYPVQGGPTPSSAAPASTPPTPASPPPTGGAQAISYRRSAPAPVSTMRGDDVLLTDAARGGTLLFDFAAPPAGAVEPVAPLESLPPAVRRPPLPLP